MTGEYAGAMFERYASSGWIPARLAAQLSLIEVAQMKVNGACHCGRITYEAEVDPERSGICHCTDCQVLSGSVYRVTVPTVAGTFRLLTGTPTAYVKTTADSGSRRRHAFCADCGAPVSAGADVDNPPTRNLRVGGLAQREHLAPKRRIWCQSALSWSQDVGSVPGVPKQ
jgi:hypothetical protein